MEYYNEQHGMQCASFRLPPVYGVGPHSEIYVNGKYYKTGIQTFIENAEAGKDIEIWGDPQRMLREHLCWHYAVLRPMVFII